jgi:hypothetical protein
MSEETSITLNLINDKIKECMNKYNINDNTLFVVPLGNSGDYGYLSNRMLNEILQLQQENKQLKEVIEEVREYVNNHIHQETFTGYMDSYELRKLLQILDKVK